MRSLVTICFTIVFTAFSACSSNSNPNPDCVVSNLEFDTFCENGEEFWLDNCGNVVDSKQICSCGCANQKSCKSDCNQKDCDDGLTKCDDLCVDTKTDPRYCGNCQTACDEGFICQDLKCQQILDCRDTPCNGFTYCDLTSGLCLAGCFEDQQCSHDKQVCNILTHECECIGNWNQATNCTSCLTGWTGEDCEQNALSVNGYHACQVMADSSLQCWGNNEYGQSTPPQGSFSQVSAGYSHTCGIQLDGQLQCFGSNEYGQSTPPQGNFIKVSAGYSHTCAIAEDRSVVCFGSNSEGQTNSPPAGSFSQISSGFLFTCAIKTNGNLACWGYNIYGQSNPPSDDFSQLSAGTYHACGVKTDGNLVCWGIDSTHIECVIYNRCHGQSEPPEGSYTKISSGEYHSCAIATDGSLACWGNDYFAQAAPPDGNNFVGLGSGDYHNCAMKSDASIVCWGNDEFGQSSPPTY
jgi:hypothetical protein